MSDVEATRYMASEREIEFVDLDSYGVDPTAAAILPVEASRRHHVVAVKRKFGTPVIATAEPDDLLAVDSIRACLGRDFISVVATPEQIDKYLELAFRVGGPPVAATSLSDLATEIGVPDDAFDQAMANFEQANATGAALPSLDLPAPPVKPTPPMDHGAATVAADSGAGADDQLADLARTLEQSGEGEAAASADDAADRDAADLVAEAVANYQTQNPTPGPRTRRSWPDSHLWPGRSSRVAACRWRR